MKDFVGIELAEGDFVAATYPNHKNLVLGRIVGITPKRIRVEYKLYNANVMDTHLYKPRNLVKLEGPHLTMKLLRGE